MPEYPAQYESEAVLSDGCARSAPTAQPGCPITITGFRPRSLYHHFFTIPRPDPVNARNLADVDYINHF